MIEFSSLTKEAEISRGRTSRQAGRGAWRDVPLKVDGYSAVSSAFTAVPAPRRLAPSVLDTAIAMPSLTRLSLCALRRRQARRLPRPLLDLVARAVSVLPALHHVPSLGSVPAADTRPVVPAHSASTLAQGDTVVPPRPVLATGSDARCQGWRH